MFPGHEVWALHPFPPEVTTEGLTAGVLCIFAACVPLSDADFDFVADVPITAPQTITYGQAGNTALRADIVRPAAAGAGQTWPAMLLIHGGRWVAGNKNDNSVDTALTGVAQKGFVTMTIDYRLANGRGPDCYQDVQTAIAYLQTNAAQYSIDPNRIYIMGQSAGGHLAAMAATDPTQNVAAAISVAAAYDIVNLSWGGNWGNAQARTAASTNLRVGPQTKPILIIHANNDQSVPIANARTMENALKAANAPHKFTLFANDGHMSMNAKVQAEAVAWIATLTTPGPQQPAPGAQPPQTPTPPAPGPNPAPTVPVAPSAPLPPYAPTAPAPTMDSAGCGVSSSDGGLWLFAFLALALSKTRRCRR